MMQKNSELTPVDIKLVWYKDLWLKYLSMCEVDYYNDERMRLEYLCNLILDDLMRPEHRQVSLNVFPHSRVKPNQTEFDKIIELLEKGETKLYSEYYQKKRRAVQHSFCTDI